jgi:hypothetical protein
MNLDEQDEVVVQDIMDGLNDLREHCHLLNMATRWSRRMGSTSALAEVAERVSGLLVMANEEGVKCAKRYLLLTPEVGAIVTSPADLHNHVFGCEARPIFFDNHLVFKTAEQTSRVLDSFQHYMDAARHEIKRLRARVKAKASEIRALRTQLEELEAVSAALKQPTGDDSTPQRTKVTEGQLERMLEDIREVARKREEEEA